METKRTPTPYILAERFADNGAYSHCDIIESADGKCIAQVLEGHDAAFIVRACNAHDELVNALEGFISQIPSHVMNEVHFSYRVAVAEALAKARGEA